MSPLGSETPKIVPGHRSIRAENGMEMLALPRFAWKSIRHVLDAARAARP